MSENDLVTMTLQALIDEEQERTANARDRLGTFVILVQKGLDLLNTCVETIDRDRFMAAALLLALRKTATLSFLSYVRAHITQAEFNMRQTVEFTALAAYLLAHPEEDVTNGPGQSPPAFKNTKSVSCKAYAWLDKEHGDVSALLKQVKDDINNTTAHASIYLTHFTFDWEGSDYANSVFKGSFFDKADDDTFRLYLMSLARLLVIVIETLRQVSEQHGGFILKSCTADNLRTLSREVDAHRENLAARMGWSDKLRG